LTSAFFEYKQKEGSGNNKDSWSVTVCLLAADDEEKEEGLADLCFILFGGVVVVVVLAVDIDVSELNDGIAEQEAAF
jgi:hypothetical protein